MTRIKKFLTNPVVRFGYFSRMGLYNKMNDEKYLKKKYKLIFHKELDLENPKTFNEKLQWLKLHDRKPQYSMMVDKYEAKKYVASIIGEEHIIPTLGVWERFEDIDFSKLPDQFVMKTTHDSGSIVICKDKSSFNIKEAKKKINKSLRRNYYLEHREWPYKNVKPRIIAETYMADVTGILSDYKFFCFNGIPKIMYISKDNSDNPGTDFFDMDFNHLNLKMRDNNSNILPDKPLSFLEMKKYAELLSKGIPHLRVDFYLINNSVYFGELTFYHMAGFQKVTPESWNEKLGDWINLDLGINNE